MADSGFSVDLASCAMDYLKSHTDDEVWLLNYCSSSPAEPEIRTALHSHAYPLC